MKEMEFNHNEERFIGKRGEMFFENTENGESFENVIKKRAENDKIMAMQKYMPIGSVVKVIGSINKYMIIGFECEDTDKKVKDYLACVYPFGVNKEHKLESFNHDQIESVYYIGFVNNQERAFKKKYNKENDINDAR